MKVVINKQVKEISDILTVEQFQRIKTEEIKLNSDPVKLLSIYLDMDVSEIKNAPKKDIDFVLAFLTNTMMKSNPTEMEYTFIHDGIEYGLDVEWDKLAWGAWSDLEVFSSENVDQNIHLILSILYRPVISKEGQKYKIVPYNSEEIIPRSEIMKKVPVYIWYNCANFFFLTVRLYITGLESSLIWKIKLMRLLQKGVKILPKFLQKRLHLDSISHSLFNSQEKILLNSNK
jgi:hypothetical protein